MLKKASNINVIKLCTIVLLEIYFNALNKNIFNNMSILEIKVFNTILEKVVYGKKI